MKSVKFFMLVAFLAVSSSAFALDNDPKSDKAVKEALTKEITSFLKKPNFKIDDTNSCKVNVHFVINSKNEVRVIDIYTTDEYLRDFIETRLDNRKIKTKNVEVRKTYLIPIKFELS